jgi:hypothetical protein
MAFAKGQFGHSDSHSLVRIESIEIPSTGFRYISIQHQLSLMTPYLRHLMGMNSTVRAKIEAKAMYDMVLGSAQMRSAMGWVFEGRVHSHLHQGGTVLFCKQLDGDHKLALKVQPGNATFSTMKELSKIPRSKPGSSEFNEALADVYIRPDRINLTAIDSLMITAGGGSPHAVFFRITLNSRHELKTDGLDAVFKALPAKVAENDPVIVFLVPEEMVDKYKSQNLEPPKAPFDKWRQWRTSHNTNQA